MVPLITISASTRGAFGFGRRRQQGDLVDLANAHARQSHFRSITQTVGISKARLQVKLLRERIQIAGRIKNQEDQNDYRDQHEDADPQLIQAYALWLILAWRLVEGMKDEG